MNTIINPVMNEIEIKKSKFITLLFPIHSISEINEKLKQVKDDYPLATHYCYAYILLQNKKCSDDGEPLKTAGQPILNVLEKHQLSHILAIVIRYFGGIKLCAGGLVRAYSKAVVEAINISTIKPLQLKTHIILSFSYEIEQTIHKLCPNLEIICKQYLENITYEGYATIDELETLKSHSKIKLQQLENSYRI